MEYLNYTLFTIGGDTPVLLIDLLTSIFGLTCVFLAGRNSKYNFYIGYIYTFFLFLMFWNKHLYASLFLQPISLAINILGHYRWTHPKREEESAEDHKALKVSMLSWPQRFFAILAVLGIGGSLGLDARPVYTRPCTVSGCMRDGAHPCGPVPFGHKEMGLLDCLAAGQHHTAHPPHFRRPCIHADCMLTVPDQWNMVTLHMV